MSEPGFERISRRKLEVLATFVPNEVLKNPQEKQRKNFVAVLLFADVSGFTKLTEKYNKTGKGGIYSLTATLNAYIGAIVEVIHLFHGDIFKFSGDAILALWKVRQGQTTYDILHVVVECALVIQKNLGVFETEVNVLLKVKLAISCGNVTFAVISSDTNKHYVVLGTAIYDVKKAEHVSVSGDVVIAPAAWSHMLHDRYVTTAAPDGNVKVWKTIYQRNEEQKRVLFNERIGEVLTQVAKHLEHRKYVNKRKTFESNSSMTKTIELFLRSLPKRETIGFACRSWTLDALRPFIIKPLQDQVDGNQPVEYLTEMREMTIQFINIIPLSLENEYLVEMCQSTYRIVCNIVGESLGVVNKVSFFDKDLMILVFFGLRGIRHEMDSQRALRSAFRIQQMISSSVPNVESCAIGITQGLVYCGVVGHPYRREYTVIGTDVNKAARIMCAYPDKVTCDSKTFKNSQLASYYFRLQSAVRLKGIEDAGAIYEYNEHFDKLRDLGEQQLRIFGRAEEYNMIRLVICKRSNIGYKGICFVGPQKIGKTTILLQSIRALRKSSCYFVISVELNSHSHAPYSTISRMYGNLFDQLGNLNRSYAFVPHLPRQLYKPDVDMWFLQEDAALFKCNILNTFRRILQVCIDTRTVVFIDNIEELDVQSWEIMQVLIDENLLVLICTGWFESTRWKVLEALQKMESIRMHDIAPIASRYIARLACMFLDAMGIPNYLEAELIHTCEGRPGYVQCCILRLVNNGSLQLKLINRSDMDRNHYIFPAEFVVNVSKEILVIVQFTERYNRIGQALTLQAISMDFFDSFSPYQQLVIKTAAVIGSMFSRSILEVALSSPTTEQLAEVVKQLFEEEVFECGTRYLYARGEEYATGKPCCRCYLPNESTMAMPLPRYAYCKLIHFKNKSLREVAYELLPGNQKKELHLLCTEILESIDHCCPSCKRQPLIYIMHVSNYTNLVQMCEDPKVAYRRQRLPPPDHGDMREVIRNTMRGIRVESLPNDLVERPHRDAYPCSCLAIWVVVYDQLRHHAEQGKHTGKRIYFTLKYGFTLLLVRDFRNAIRSFRETIELCLVDVDEARYIPMRARFTNIIMGRAHLGLVRAYLALGQLQVAKSHAMIALRQYNIPSLAFEHRVVCELLRRTFVVNVRQMYARTYANTILRFDCGNALAHCAKIFTLEGKWALARATALHSAYCLRTINPNVALLYEVYCNVVDIFTYVGQRLALEKLQKYVFREVAHNFSSASVNNLSAIVTLMETLLESHFACGHIGDGIRLGFRMLDLCARVDYFVSDSRLFFHLPLLLLFYGRIRDAGAVLKICKQRVARMLASETLYYVVAFVVYLLSGFTVESVDDIVNFASRLKTDTNPQKRISEFLFTLVRLHYVQLGKFHKAEEWTGEKAWNWREVMSTVPMFELTFVLKCMILRFVRNRYQEEFATQMELKRIKKLLQLLKENCTQYTIYLPICYYMQAWLHRVTGHKKKSKKFLKKISAVSKQQNVLMECQVLAASNAWSDGFYIPYDNRPDVSYLAADNYSLRELAQFLPVDVAE